MTRVALRSLWGRKLRFFLTALAIVLGVSMVSGTYVLTDTIEGGLQHDLPSSPTRRPTSSISGKCAFGPDDTERHRAELLAEPAPAGAGASRPSRRPTAASTARRS